MLPLKITRRRDASVDSKQLLRTCVDELSVDQQREFVLMAVQLIIARPSSRAMEFGPIVDANSSPARRCHMTANDNFCRR